MFIAKSVKDERKFFFPKIPRFPPNIGLFVCYSPNSGHRAQLEKVGQLEKVARTSFVL